MKHKQQGFSTKSIHACGTNNEHQALNDPLYLNSTFDFKSIQQAQDTFNFDRKAYVYSRGGNPTVNNFEKKMAMLESGIDSVAFSSGMSAVTTTILSLCKSGDTILAHRNLYGCTYKSLSSLFNNFGIKTVFINMTDEEELKEHINDKIKVIFFETPTNPSLDIIDINKVTHFAKNHDIKVIVDNTFCTPFLQNPLTLGADIVVHSASKYISGHGDLIAGIAVSNDQEYINKLKFEYMCKLGGVLSPFDAWLAARGLDTLDIRMQRHQQNAEKVAEFLSNHPKIDYVFYPGLKSHPGHDVAQKQMRGFGGVVTFGIDGPIDSAVKFVESMKLSKISVSLGDIKTLIQIPSLMTHKDYPKESLHKHGFQVSTIRISLGLENHEDILDDICQSLQKI